MLMQKGGQSLHDGHGQRYIFIPVCAISDRIINMLSYHPCSLLARQLPAVICDMVI